MILILLSQALTEYVTQGFDGNPAIANLPRKFNICVVGSHDMFEHPHINDIALVPATCNDTGKLGFLVEVKRAHETNRAPTVRDRSPAAVAESSE